SRLATVPRAGESSQGVQRQEEQGTGCRRKNLSRTAGSKSASPLPWPPHPACAGEVCSLHIHPFTCSLDGCGKERTDAAAPVPL
ncbi:unnamed protein product, partial [Ectocarpus sp. 12 AP-2014]